MANTTRIKQFVSAALRQTKQIPSNLVTKKLIIDLEYGLVYPEIRGFDKEASRNLFDLILPNMRNFQNTFHKSWETIAKTDQFDLWKDAALHYFSTYGRESLGIDSPDYVYLPDEIDSTPELRKFRLISVITPEKLIEDTTSILDSGVALSQPTIEDFYTILDGLMYPYDFSRCKNREARTIFAARSLSIPDDGEEIVRVLNFLITKNTLLIKNRVTFSMFKIAKQVLTRDQYEYVRALLRTRDKACASVFYRYKPLFLALRYADFKYEINQIRRLAKYCWKPKPQAQFLSTQSLSGEVDFKSFDHLSNFELVKIYNKLAFLTYTCGIKKEIFHELIVVRNGKLFVDPTADCLSMSEIENALSAQTYLKTLLQNRLNPKNSRRVILPDNLELAFPTSEKTFIGDIPLYSRAVCSESSVVGIAWKNDDLDLSAILENHQKIGWNSDYKTANQDIMYSGDMTRGGAEALYFGSPHSALIMMNVYYGNIPEVDLFISNEKKFNLRSQRSQDRQENQYIYDPNNIIYSAKLRIDGISQILGLYDKLPYSTQFTFVNLRFGSGIVSAGGELTPIVMSTLRDRGASSLKLSDIFPKISSETFAAELKHYSDPKDKAKLARLKSSVIDLSDPRKTDILTLVNPKPN